MYRCLGNKAVVPEGSGSGRLSAAGPLIGGEEVGGTSPGRDRTSHRYQRIVCLWESSQSGLQSTSPHGFALVRLFSRKVNK